MKKREISTYEISKIAKKISIVDHKNLRILSHNNVEYLRQFEVLPDKSIKFQFRDIVYTIEDAWRMNHEPHSVDNSSDDEDEWDDDNDDNDADVEVSDDSDDEDTENSSNSSEEDEEDEEETPPPVPVEAKHAKYEVIKTCIEQDIPVYLVGEAGTGKNFTLQEIAVEMGLAFYFTNSVQQEYKITGFIDAGGIYHETEFYKAFKNGGLFFLDEMDASIPEVLVLLNAAIANKYFEFPNGRVDAHEKFRVVAAGNTCGNGANELYTGRLVLDQATLDRFVVIEFDYDKNVEYMLAKGNDKLVNFIRALRRFSKDNGIRATFSYRCIMTVVKLEACNLPLEQILRIAVFKGLDEDTVKTFKTDFVKDGNIGRYHYGLKNLQKEMGAVEPEKKMNAGGFVGGKKP
mgnify:FL=1